MTPHPLQSRTSRAFSMVEVTLAIGITAFAGLAVLGLLPVGLSNFRNAADVNISSQILQRVISDVGQADFATLVKEGEPLNALPVRRFDEQGSECDTNVASRAVYHVAVGISVNDTGSLATVVVDVVNNPADSPLPRDESTGGFSRKSDDVLRMVRRTAYVACTQ